ncbi:hypothetical protein AZE41_18250 [Sporosarcina psychrophila]|nr:hypothetical protein AZE41_18250 [Sporosarcina psychrophila]
MRLGILYGKHSRLEDFKTKVNHHLTQFVHALFLYLDQVTELLRVMHSYRDGEHFDNRTRYPTLVVL